MFPNNSRHEVFDSRLVLVSHRCWSPQCIPYVTSAHSILHHEQKFFKI